MSLPLNHDLLLPDVFAHHARSSPDRPAIICEGESRSWKEVEAGTRRVANALIAHGIGKGDKVCIFMQSSILMFEIMWGAIRAGAVAVPLNTMLAPDSLARAVNNSQGRLLFTDTTNLGMVTDALPAFSALTGKQVYVACGAAGAHLSAEAFVQSGSTGPLDVAIAPDDSMCILYTSGTTGAPKGAEHVHSKRLAYLAFGFLQWLRFERTSVTLCATPLHTNGTWVTMLPTMYLGGTLVVLPKFSATAFFDAVEREKCSHVFLVPTQQVTLMAHPRMKTSDISSLKVLHSSGQTLLPAMHEALRRSFPGVAISDCYGMSEGFGTVATEADYALGKMGSVGKPILLDDIRIIDENDNELPPGSTGEIVGCSVGLMKGYYGDPERTRKAYWQRPGGRAYLRSGDVGYFDADGYLFVCGRIKDMIKSGGIAVYATDIEEVFMQHPAVLEAAAISVPHDKWLETPLLLVRLHAGARITEAELAEWGNARLGKYQRVSGVEFRDEFPRATYGKVQKAELRAPYWADRAGTTAAAPAAPAA